jgi:hypothetical protein
MAVFANIVLLVHFAFAGFVVLGLLATWIGAAMNWAWIRNRRFRQAHLVAIGIVAAESVAGIACPLTVLEDMLRNSPAQADFIARWLQRLLYYDAPAWAFTTAYLAWGLAAGLTWRWVPPRH